MDFNRIDWADSNIVKMEIEFDCAKLYIFNDTLQQMLIVKFNGFIGMTNLLMWDDQIIDDAEVRKVQEDDPDPFIQMLFSRYDKDFNYGERWLNRGVLDVQIRLINDTTFHIYCQSIEVSSDSHLYFHRPCFKKGTPR